LFSNAAYFCVVTPSTRTLVIELILVNSINFRPYLGTLYNLGSNALLTGQLAVTIVLHISFVSTHLFYKHFLNTT